jgi:MFS family permease
MKTVVRISRLLLLGLWLGAAIFFGAAVAPSLFGVLRGANLGNANELAGTIVTRLLAVINRGGFEIALFLIVTGYFVTRHESRRRRLAEMISLGIMTIMTGIGQWVISARMLALRTAMQVPIDQIGHEDPRRIAFGAWHHYSVMAMGVAIVAALAAFIVMARGSSPTPESPDVQPG